jgi:hypothetical protein
VSAAQTKKAGAHCCAPASIRLSVYGLELTDECGTAIGPSDCSSSDSPMHWPELPPVHGMLSTSGSPPATSGQPQANSAPDRACIHR